MSGPKNAINLRSLVVGVMTFSGPRESIGETLRIQSRADFFFRHVFQSEGHSRNHAVDHVDGRFHGFSQPETSVRDGIVWFFVTHPSLTRRVTINQQAS